jgi:hypothetical protein
MPSACGGTRCLEGAHRRLLLASAAALAGTRQLGVELLLAAEEAAAGYAHIVENHLGRVRGADAVLGVLLALRQPLGAGRNDEAGLAAALQLGIDRSNDDVDVGDAAVGDPRLGAVEHPLVGRLVVHGPGAQAADIAAGVGLAHAEGAELHV